ncbi:AAA-like domain-containing protein [Anaerolineales bacterium HSG24]|nr:AAA-like domain-containing protein [Anaerolineales bacterium HSG24]
MANPYIYTVGGTVGAGEGVYIPRQADNDLLALCQQGAFAYVLSSRQMGKSSLMVRVAKQLYEEGIIPVIISLDQLGAKEITPEAWYLGLLNIIDDELELDVNVTQWWQERTDLGLAQRLTLFFRDVVLTEIDQPIVIFVDEIDTTLSMGSFTDDFFTTIRYLYNARSTVPVFRRLSFVLLGVATPSDLINDPKRTPFNIGQRVDVTDFTPKEAEPLVIGLGLETSSYQQVLAWVLQWTGGHPYLTQRLFSGLAQETQTTWTETQIDQLVHDIFLGDQSIQDNNLEFVRDMLTKWAPDLAGVLSIYRVVRQGFDIPDNEQSVITAHLKLSGVIKRDGQYLRVRNRIYETVFTVKWVEEVEERENVADPVELARTKAFAKLQEETAAADRLRAEEAERRVKEQVTAQQKQADLERQRFEQEKKFLAEEQRAIEQELRAKAEQERAEEASHRAELEAKAAQRFRVWLIGIIGLAVLLLIAVIAAGGFGYYAQQSSLALQTAQALEIQARQAAQADQATAVAQATVAAMAQQRAETAATQEALAKAASQNQLQTAVAAEATAQFEATRAIEAEQTAQAGQIQLATAAAVAGAESQLALEAKQTADAGATQEAIAKSTAQAGSTRSFEAEQTAQAEANRAIQAEQTAQFESTRSSQAEATAKTGATQEAQARATAQAESTRAIQAEQTAQFESTRSTQAEATAKAGATQEAIAKATAQAESTRAIQAEQTAIAEGERANELARLATSRELAAKAPNFSNIEYDLALLLSLEANQIADIVEGRGRLAEVLQANSKLLVIRYGHTDTIRAVAIHPNAANPILASGSKDTQVKLWDISNPANPESTHTLTEPRSRVLSLAFSPDGQYLSSGDNSSDIYLWDTTTFDQLSRSEHGSGIWGLGFNPTSPPTLLASGSDDPEVLVWNINNGISTSLRGHTDDVRAVAFNSVGTQLISAGDDKSFKIWDTTSFDSFPLIGGMTTTYQIFSVAFVGNDNLLATGGTDGSSEIWDISTPTSPVLVAMPTAHNSIIYSLSYDPNQQLLASGSANQSVILWDVSTPNTPIQKEQLVGIGSIVYSVDFSPDGRNLVAGTGKGALFFWDMEAGLRLGQRITETQNGLFGQVKTVAQAGILFATGDSNGQIVLWNIETQQPLSQFGHPLQINSLAFSPDGQRLASASEDGSIILWNIADPANPQSVGSPFVDDNSPVRAVTFSPDGQILASGGENGYTALWDITEPDNPISKNRINTRPINSIAFNHSGQILVSGSDDSAIIIWDSSNLNDLRLRSEIPDHSQQVNHVAFSPTQDNLFVSAGSDNAIFLWDVTDPSNPNRQSSLVGHTSFVLAVAFSPDGQTLASGGGDSAVILWDVSNPASGQQITTLSGHTDSVNSVVFSNNQAISATLISGSDDSSVIMWDVDLKSWKDKACHIAGRNLTQSELDQFITDPNLHPTTPACSQYESIAPEIQSALTTPEPPDMGID